jgi:hypothetical protein
MDSKLLACAGFLHDIAPFGDTFLRGAIKHTLTLHVAADISGPFMKQMVFQLHCTSALEVQPALRRTLPSQLYHY